DCRSAVYHSAHHGIGQCCSDAYLGSDSRTVGSEERSRNCSSNRIKFSGLVHTCGTTNTKGARLWQRRRSKNLRMKNTKSTSANCSESKKCSAVWWGIFVNFRPFSAKFLPIPRSAI